MSKKDVITKSEKAEDSGLSRRKFIGGTAGVAAAAVATGGLAIEPLINTAAVAEAKKPGSTGVPGGLPTSQNLQARRVRCKQVRDAATQANFNAGVVSHPVNGDEQLYASKIGNFSKGLPHNSLGEVDLTAYASLIQAISSSDPADYDAIITNGGPASRMGNPQAGLSYDLEGADGWAVAVPAPPALASKEEASELVEHYWQALLRDVNFLDYGASPLAAAAAADLTAFGADFKGPKVGGAVTPQSLFRSVAPGTLVGPYIAQFMWLNTPYGAEQVDRKTWTKLPIDHNLTFGNFLAVQNGFVPEAPAFAGLRRYIINGRDLAEWVHIDVLFQAYFNACLILGQPPSGADNGGGIGAPPNPTNPYVGNPSQYGFVTFGPPGMKTLLCEVSTRCLKATWHKKWQIHRRLRPENMAGLVEVQLNQDPGRYTGALHPSLFASSVLAPLAAHNGGSYLLPMAFPEGCPTHPAYTAGHATVAGACVTILKALFDENFVIPNPVVPDPTGSFLVPFVGPPLTVGGELNKLASNVAEGRNIAGVHWRTDAHASLRHGEAIAVSVLRDQKFTYNEGPANYSFTGFDGQTIII